MAAVAVAVGTPHPQALAIGPPTPGGEAARAGGQAKSIPPYPPPGNAQTRVPPQSCTAQRPTLTREANIRFGIPSPTPVLAAQMFQESACNPRAVSPVGAQGLMQFMPQTAQWAATANAWGAPQPFNPEWSIRAGVWYDRWLYDRVRHAETACDRWHFALSAYNGGLGWVHKRQAKSPRPGHAETTLDINPGITAANQHENSSYSRVIIARHQVRFLGWGERVC